jgi:hypothetical protein
MFLLNQLYCERQNLTPLQFAANTVDKKYHTDFEKFIKIYLQLKYANTDILSDEEDFVEHFYLDFEKKIKKNHKLFEQIKRFLNIKQTLKFYTHNYGTAKRNG